MEQGIIEEVVRPLMSGKEAQVYLVVAQGEQYVAKIYKEADHRSFKHRSEYTEGRRVRNTRDQRAMNKRSQYGRSQQEATWRAAEVDVIYRLRNAGVRVPEPKLYVDNVLVMELVTDREGNPAPRLADVRLQRKQAEDLFEGLLREVCRMLCAGLVHGDLSEYNILVGADEFVIIDFPQAVDSASNRNARKLLRRDIANLARFLGRHSPGLRSLRYGDEMWDLYERGELTPDTKLTGRFERKGKRVEVSSLLQQIEEMERENRNQRIALGLPPSRPARQPVHSAPDKAEAKDRRPAGRSRRRRKGKPAEHRPTTPSSTREKSQQRQQQNAAEKKRTTSASHKPRRRRRSRRKPGGGRAPST